MSELRKVDLLKNNNSQSSANKMMPKQEARDYSESVKETVDYINNIAALLQQHNDRIRPIVESYNARKNRYMDSMRQ